MIVRTIDEGRRLGIPKAVLLAIGITGKADVKLDIEGDKLVITKVENVCKLCGTEKDIIQGFSICRNCAEKIADVVNLK